MIDRNDAVFNASTVPWSESYYYFDVGAHHWYNTGKQYCDELTVMVDKIYVVDIRFASRRLKR